MEMLELFLDHNVQIIMKKKNSALARNNLIWLFLRQCNMGVGIDIFCGGGGGGIKF